MWLSIVLLGAVPSVVLAQPTTKGEPAKAKADAPDAGKAKEDADAPKDQAPAAEAAADEESERTIPVEVFKDPVAEKILAAKFRPLTAVPFPTSNIKQVKDMAAVTTIDRAMVSKYVAKFAADLTAASNIKGVIEPPTGTTTASTSLGMRAASSALMDPIDIARRANNTAFLNIYTQELLKSLPPVLENHLISRIEAIIILGQTASPEVVDLFVKVLNDPEQTIWVKLWAARGITNIVQGPGGNRVDATLGARGIPAAKALTNFLNKEKDAPWFAQLRVLEALGGLRLSAEPGSPTKIEMAEAAARLLSDPEARPEVRAEAAWALGMLRFSPAARLNSQLLGYYIGEVTADLGEKIASTYSENNTRAQFMTSLMIYQLFPALYGQDGAGDSGLVKTGGPGASGFLGPLTDQVRGVTTTAIELTIKSPKARQAQFAKDLGERVGQLRAFLDKNAPADKHLVPGGTEYPVKAQVAGVPAEKPKVADGSKR
ncbi:HEAT repeat domain-containing protein [Singulisphaera rosea]